MQKLFGFLQNFFHVGRDISLYLVNVIRPLSSQEFCFSLPYVNHWGIIELDFYSSHVNLMSEFSLYSMLCVPCCAHACIIKVGNRLGTYSTHIQTQLTLRLSVSNLSNKLKRYPNPFHLLRFEFSLSETQYNFFHYKIHLICILSGYVRACCLWS